ncbi:hypothetical protein BDZ89DRAFT_1213198 [Hymenopellis radicata]|nr:hypothetical protein BDZ89DRAFT_1213198 [Hymenopellis radicata]
MSHFHNHSAMPPPSWDRNSNPITSTTQSWSYQDPRSGPDSRAGHRDQPLPSFQDSFSGQLFNADHEGEYRLPPPMDRSIFDEEHQHRFHKQSPEDDSFDLGPTNTRLPPTNTRLPASRSHPLEISSDEEEYPPRKRSRKEVQRHSPSPVRSSRRRKSSAASAAVSTISKKKGRKGGSANYNADDMDALHAILHKRLPISAMGWNSTADEFNKWAKGAGRPVRESKSLENKFKTLVKVTKPTGDGVIPDIVVEALKINSLMDEKGEVGDVDDDSGSEGSDASEKENDIVEVVRKPKKGPVARRRGTDRLSIPSASTRNGSDLLSGLSSMVSPAAQQARMDEMGNRSFQSTQFMAMNSQLRDFQRQMETMRTQMMGLERERNEEARRADRAEMLSMVSRHSPVVPAHDSRIRQDVYYSDGGRSRQYLDINSTADTALMSGQFDSPGTRRYVIDEDPSPVAAPLRRPLHPPVASGSRTPSSREQVATASGTPTRKGGDSEGVELMVSPAGQSEGISVFISPRRMDSRSEM